MPNYVKRDGGLGYVEREPGPLAQFDAAIQTVTQHRSGNYGNPSDNFRRAQAMTEVVRDCSDAELRHCMEMIAGKLARLIETPGHMDSWIDIAGYARCAAMILNDRQEDTSDVERPE